MDSLLTKNPEPDKDGQREEQEEEEPEKNWPQYLAAIIANFVLLIAGTNLGWSSPILPKLMDENSTLPVTDDQGTWIGSLVAVGAILGPFPGGICADWIGRKRALIAVAVPHLASWCILAAAGSVGWLYLGRILAGFANGWGMTILPMYIGEIATANSRGALVVLGQIMITLGFLVIYVIGATVSYVWINIICALIPAAFFITFTFMPESPFYEVSKGNLKEASKNLSWLRGKSSDGVKAELMDLQAASEESSRNTGTWGELFSKKANKKAVFLLCGLMVIQQFSGVNAVLFYSDSIFQKAGSSLSPSLCSILLGLAQFLSSFPAPYLIEKLGRRAVLILSSLGMMVCQGIIGVVSFLDTIEYDTTNFGWIPIVSIIGYILFYCLGVGPVPWGMIGEMFAPSIRSKGAAFTASFSWFLAFLITKAFGLIVEGLGSHSAFWIFSVFCGLGAAFVYFLLPETKGKTLEEIQEMLTKT